MENINKELYELIKLAKSYERDFINFKKKFENSQNRDFNNRVNSYKFDGYRTTACRLSESLSEILSNDLFLEAVATLMSVNEGKEFVQRLHSYHDVLTAVDESETLAEIENLL